MNETEKKVLPGWVWAMLALAVVSAVLFLFFTDRRPEPGPALRYDVSEYEAVEEEAIRYAERQRLRVELEEPYGLAVAGDGRLLVVGDTGLLMLDAAGRELVRRELPFPSYCVAVAADGVSYLGGPDGVAVLATPESESVYWDTPGENILLTSVAVNEQHVYAADAVNARVLQYDRSGRLLREFGGPNDPENPRRFIVPSPYFDIAFDSMGSLWITNPGKLGVENYRENGELLSTWHKPGMGVDAFAGCCNPAQIAFKRGTTLVSAEKGLNRVKTFAADRSFAGVVAAPEAIQAGWSDAGNVYARAPIRDLAVDADDRILVLHGPLHCILVYEECVPGKDVE
ncbi:MAG TPA: hypothetical protein PKO23_03690 [Candidatus Hydrogenedentes bacterium]|jgi:hypothetical protein|nr:hypothetical protein [Candidatus Hydrogenedentota bacterium]